MTTFARPSLLDNRYANIAETSIFTYDDDDLVNYADFLRKYGRYMTKSGYVDSSRRVRSLHRRQDNLIISKNKNLPSRSGLLAPLKKLSLLSSSAPSTTTPGKLTESTTNELPSVISVSKNLENKEKEYDQHLRLIEGQIIKSKQSEREGRRLDNDIKKEQRHLSHTLKELQIDSVKNLDSEKHLLMNFEEEDRTERKYRKKEQQATQRTDHLVDASQVNQEKVHRDLLVCNDLARKYRTKANELEMKQQQLTQLHVDFENQVQQKGFEENQIKKQLGEIAMALNSEAHKTNNDMNQFLNAMQRDQTQKIKRDLVEQQKFEERLNQTSIHVKNYDLERRRLSGDVELHRSMIDLKQREALRRIVDTKNRLENIYSKQRELNQFAAIAEQDRRAAELMTKMATVENRRTQLANEYLREKIERSEERETQGANKAKVCHAEHETRQHEDHLRHFQKAVSKNVEVQQDLRKSVKEEDFERQKKEQEVQQLKEEIARKKRLDDIHIREEIAKAEREERELEQKLIKEKSKLDKLHTQCGDSYLRLLKQREQIRETKSLLRIHEREYERLLRVHARSQSLQSLNTI